MNKLKDRIFQKLYTDDLIRAAYRGILKREPDPEGLEEYRTAIARSGDPADILAAIASSDEVGRKYFTALAPDLVQAVYRGLLGRDPDREGMSTYAEQLTAPDGLSKILDSIIHSKEFHKSRSSQTPCSNGDSCTVFLHIQKTGGTSLQNMFLESYSKESVYNEHTDTLSKHTQHDLSRYSLFAGHFNFDSLAFIPHKKKSIFTFLREPKSRLLSLYYFWRAHEPGHKSYAHNILLANKLLIEPFFEDGHIKKTFGTWNTMTWAVMGRRKWKEWQELLLAQKNQETAAEIIEKIVRPAILKRLNEFSFIGLQECYEESVNLLYGVLGKRRPETIRADHSLEKLMKNDPQFKKSMDKQPMTSRLDAALDSLVQLDIVLYEEGKKIFAEQCANISSSKKIPADIPTGRKASLPLDLVPLTIESDATEEQLRVCLTKIEAAWSHLGKVRPHFSVLSQKEFLPKNLNAALEDFWISGENEAARIERILGRHGCSSLDAKTCVEYGCGVGRVTIGLARRFASVHGYDISSTHLSFAEQRANEVAADNAIFHLCSENLLEPLVQCDVFYSKLVFQHNPPPVISNLIRSALQALRPGGIGIFQVPTYILGYRFNLAEWFVEEHALDMQMHCLPQRKIFEIIARANCIPLEIREDDATGAPEKFLSNTFIVYRCG